MRAMSSACPVRLVHFVVVLASVISSSATHLSARNPLSVGIRSALTSTHGFGLFSPRPSRTASHSISVRATQCSKFSSARKRQQIHSSRKTREVANNDIKKVELCGYASPPKGVKVGVHADLSEPPKSASANGGAAVSTTISPGRGGAVMAVARRLYFWENMISHKNLNEHRKRI